MLKGQDILVLVKLALRRESEAPRQVDLAEALGLSQSEVAKSLKRCAEAGLLDLETRRVFSRALLEFLEHGFKYVFPAKLGVVARGIPTAWAAPALAKRIVSNSNEMPVWPTAFGDLRGASVKPVYPTVPDAVRRDPKLHDALSFLDAMRLGRTRERQIATEELKKLFEDNLENA